MRRIWLCIPLFAACAGSSPAANERDAATAVAALDSVYASFARAYRATEPDSVLALYTDSAYYLPGQGDVLAGREEMRPSFGFLTALREAGRRPHIRFEILDRGISGDLAYDIGYYDIEIEDSAGSRTPGARGKFVLIWKRENGEWRIQADSFSPAPRPS